MPLLGLGTYNLRGKECEKVLDLAFELGYRLIDSAQMYENEKQIGFSLHRALKAGIKREELFITTKLSHSMSYEQTLKSIEDSLDKLGLDYVDLLLIHSPYSQALQMYKAMEDCYKQGKIKALGLSNFNAKLLLKFISCVKIPPVLNQIQTHIFFQRLEFLELLKQKGIIMQAWSPFIAGLKGLFENKLLQEIAYKHQKTVAQVALRFLAQLGISVIPKASKREHLKQNLEIFDFVLDSKDMEQLKSLDKNKSFFSWDKP